jgi:hypothetical protein
MTSAGNPDWQFYRHMPVYLASGRRLGRTVEIGHALDWLHVRRGRWLVRDWYVPITAVRDVDGDGVFLDVDRRALRSLGWHVPPMEYLTRQGATPGYEYTSTRDLPGHGDAAAPE